MTPSENLPALKFLSKINLMTKDKEPHMDNYGN